MAIDYEKLSAKADGSPVQGTDYLYAIRGSATVKVLASGLADAGEPAAAAALAAHVVAADPHPGYLTPAEGNAAYATTAQGAKADTALQPANNLSELAATTVAQAAGRSNLRLSTIAQLMQRGAAILKPFGHTNSAVGAGNTFVYQAPADGDFVGVRVVYLNYQTTGDVIIDMAKVAPSPTNANTGTALTWTLVTFGGSSTGIIPAGTQVIAGSSISVAPGVLISDLIFVSSVARTDTPANKPLLQVRTYHSAAGNVPTFGTTATVAAANALAGGRQYGTNYSPGDLVTTTGGALTPTTGVTFAQPAAVQFYYTGLPAYTLAAAGDSRFSGYLGSGDQLGPILRAANIMTDGTKIVSPCTFSVTGQSRRVSYQVQLQIIDELCPDMLMAAPWSANNTITQAELDMSWVELLDVVERCRRKNIIPVVTTEGPVNSQNGAANTLRGIQNARVLALPRSVLVVDLNAIYEDPANLGKILPAYDSGDGLHYNDAGYAAGGAEIARVLNLVL